MFRINHIENLLIYALILYISFFSILPSYTDEIIIILLVSLGILKNTKITKIDIIQLLLAVIYITISFINIIFKKYDMFAYLADLIYIFKPFLLINTLFFLTKTKKEQKSFFRFLIITNTISIIYGSYLYFLAQKGVYIDGGQYRNWIYRFSGLGGHPANIANLCLCCIMYIMSEKNIFNVKFDKLIRYILFLINIIVIYLSGSRIQLLFLILYIIYYVFNTTNSKFIKEFIVFSMCMVLVFSIVNIGKILDFYNNDIDNAVRFYALKKTPKILSKYSLFGTGIGTFSTKESLKLNSYVYSEFGFSYSILQKLNNSNSISLFESNLAKQLIETGIIGTLIYYSLLGIMLAKLKKENFNSKILLIIIIINSILNVFYNIQLLVPLILFSLQEKEGESLNEV